MREKREWTLIMNSSHLMGLVDYIRNTVKYNNFSDVEKFALEIKGEVCTEEDSFNRILGDTLFARAFCNNIYVTFVEECVCRIMCEIFRKEEDDSIHMSMERAYQYLKNTGIENAWNIEKASREYFFDTDEIPSLEKATYYLYRLQMDKAYQVETNCNLIETACCVLGILSALAGGTRDEISLRLVDGCRGFYESARRKNPYLYEEEPFFQIVLNFPWLSDKAGTELAQDERMERARMGNEKPFAYYQYHPIYYLDEYVY